MKKIMFDDRYGLTEAVLEKRKTMTRRVEHIHLLPGSRKEDIVTFRYVAKDGKFVLLWYDNKGNRIAQLVSRYAIGEEVAVAQSYGSIEREIKKDGLPLNIKDKFRKQKGWTNKMLARADLMPHRIRITNIRRERLQDISDEDCLREGITTTTEGKNEVGDAYGWDVKIDAIERDSFFTPRAAFAALIDKVSGKGTWERNPWVFVYDFELVK